MKNYKNVIELNSDPTKEVSLDLIKGSFLNAEAREILLDLFDTKINFHVLKNLSSEIRNNHSDLVAKNRVAELQEMRKMVETLLDNESLQDQRLSIKAEVIISFE